MELLKKHLLSIICIISIIALFLPFVSVIAEVFGFEETNTASGFDAANKGFLGYLLFLAPILLIAMNYIKQLEKYRGIISLAVPPICIVVLIIVFFQAKNVAVQVDLEFVDVSVGIGFGTILAAICYIAMGIIGAKTHGAEILKNANITDFQSLMNKISQLSKDKGNSTSSTSNEKTQILKIQTFQKKRSPLKMTLILTN